MSNRASSPSTDLTLTLIPSRLPSGKSIVHRVVAPTSASSASGQLAFGAFWPTDFVSPSWTCCSRLSRLTSSAPPHPAVRAAAVSTTARRETGRRESIARP